MLHRGKGDEDAVGAPQVPTCWAVRHAVLDHGPHRKVDYAVRVVTPRRREIRHVQAEICPALRTIVLRLGDHQVTGTPGIKVTQIMQRALLALIAIGVVPTMRTGVLLCVATTVTKLWLWEILRTRDTFRAIGPVDAGSWHTWIRHANKGGTGKIRCQALSCLPETRFLYYSISFSGSSRPPCCLRPRTPSVLSFLNGIELAIAYLHTNAARTASHSWFIRRVCHDRPE